MANNRIFRSGESESNIGTNWQYAPPVGGITNSTADVVVKAAVAAKKNYMTSATLGVGVVLANASEIVIKRGSTVVWRNSYPVTVGPPTQIFFDPPLETAVNEAFNVAAVTSFATGNLTFNAQGYTV